MAQQYNTTAGAVEDAVQQTYGPALANAITQLLGGFGAPVDAQSIESADEIDDSTADALFIDIEGDQTLQFNDSGRTQGRAYVFEGDRGYTATFNTIERVIIGSGGGDDFTVNGDRNTTVAGGLGDDVLTTSGGNDSITGGVGSDSIMGAAGSDTIDAGTGNDTIAGGAGDDTVYGGSGEDMVQFSGNRSDFTIEQDGGVVRVTDRDGSSDTLVNVEQLRFDDEVQMVDYDEELVDLATLYDQVFERQADLSGFQFWADAIEADILSTGEVAVEFITSPEANLTLDLSTEQGISQAVDILYSELLGRGSDESGKEFWVNALTERGASFDDVAQGFVDSIEFQGLTVNPSEWDFLI